MHFLGFTDKNVTHRKESDGIFELSFFGITEILNEFIWLQPSVLDTSVSENIMTKNPLLRHKL